MNLTERNQTVTLAIFHTPHTLCFLEKGVCSPVRFSLKDTIMSVCLSLTGSKKHCRLRHQLWEVWMLSWVTGRGEHESGVRFPPMTLVARQPIPPDFLKNTLPEGYSTRGIRDSLSLENPLVNREPMEIKLVGNKLFCGISIRETRKRDPNPWKTHWSAVNQWKLSSWKNACLLLIESTTEVPRSNKTAPYPVCIRPSKWTQKYRP